MDKFHKNDKIQSIDNLNRLVTLVMLITTLLLHVFPFYTVRIANRI